MIEFREVSKSFDGKEVLKDLSFCLETGKHYCLHAPSGIGKTTVLNLLAGLIQPDHGKVKIPHGTRFSYVFQEDRLLEYLTAEQNIRLVSNASAEECRETLLTLGLTEADLKCPCGDFSGGMKRRAALARALLADWDVLLLDEPYKGLDTEVREKAMNLVAKATEGRTMVLVTHDLAEAPDCEILPIPTPNID